MLVFYVGGNTRDDRRKRIHNQQLQAGSLSEKLNRFYTTRDAFTNKWLILETYAKAQFRMSQTCQNYSISVLWCFGSSARWLKSRADHSMNRKNIRVKNPIIQVSCQLQWTGIPRFSALANDQGFKVFTTGKFFTNSFDSLLVIGIHGRGEEIWEDLDPPPESEIPYPDPSQTRCLGKILTKNVFLMPFWAIFRPASGIFRKVALPRFWELPTFSHRWERFSAIWVGPNSTLARNYQPGSQRTNGSNWVFVDQHCGKIGRNRSCWSAKPNQLTAN